MRSKEEIARIDDAFKEIAELHYSEGIQGVVCAMVDKDGDIRMVQACDARASLILLGAIRFVESEFINGIAGNRGQKKTDLDYDK